MFSQQPTTVLPRRYSGSTAGMRRGEKFEYWHDVVCRNVVDLDCAHRDGEDFEASIEGVELPGLNLWRIHATAHAAARSPLSIARASSDSMVVNFVVSGRLQAEQDGKSVLLSAGDGALCDANRPYLLRLNEPVSIACVKLPRSALSQRSVGLQRATAVSFENASSLCPLVFGYVANLTRRGPQLTPASSDKASRNFVELLGAMVDEVIAASPLPLSEYRAVALMRVKEFVELHLSDGEMDSAGISAALKLSPRYINQLLEAEGTSLSRYIWRRRLERAAADLRDPALFRRSVSGIAFSHGFNDLSHFGKVFRRTFGQSPREHRSGAVPGASDSSVPSARGSRA